MPVSTPIPRIIWAYWNGDSVPLLIQRCFDNWARLNPGYSLRILNDAQLPQYVPQLPGNLQQLPVAKRSDWLRLELLHRHGGIWLDASTILTEPLDWLLEQQQRSGADLVAYYLERYTRDLQVPVVENWLMAAPRAAPSSPHCTRNTWSRSCRRRARPISPSSSRPANTSNCARA